MNCSRFVARSARRAQRDGYKLFGLLAQQMAGVSNQFRYRVGFRRIVIAADLTASIYEHHSRAVHWKSLRIASV